MSRDPLGEAGGMNLYGFNYNNPINFVDTNGLFPINSDGSPAGHWDDNGNWVTEFDNGMEVPEFSFDAMDATLMVYATIVPSSTLPVLIGGSGLNQLKKCPPKFTRYMASQAERIASWNNIDKIKELVRKFGGKAKDWRKMKTKDEGGQEWHYYWNKSKGRKGLKRDGDPDPF